jgi:hypothetical protein
MIAHKFGALQPLPAFSPFLLKQQELLAAVTKVYQPARLFRHASARGLRAEPSRRGNRPGWRGPTGLASPIISHEGGIQRATTIETSS